LIFYYLIYKLSKTNYDRNKITLFISESIIRNIKIMNTIRRSPDSSPLIWMDSKVSDECIWIHWFM